MNVPRAATKIFIANGTGTVLATVGLIFFARELGSFELGVFFLFQSMFSLLIVPVEFGMGRAVVKRVSEGGDLGEIFSSAAIIKTIPLLLISAGILVFRGSIDEYLGADLAVFLIIALTLRAFATLMLSVLRGQLRVDESAFPLLSKQIVYVSLGAVLVVSGFGAKALVYALLAGIAVKLSLATYRSSLSIGRPARDTARSLVDFSIYSFVSSAGWFVHNWIDILIIGFILSQSEVGVYEVAWRVSAIVLLFSRSLATTIFPQISEYDGEDAIEQIESLLGEAITPALFLVVPAFFGALLFSTEILTFVFGAEYASGSLVLVILLFGKGFEALFYIIGYALQGIDRPDLSAKAGLLTLLLNVILNVALISMFGILGAAVATVLSFVANTILHWYFLSRFVTLDWPLRRLAGVLAASLVMAGVLLAIRGLVEPTSLLRLLVLIGIGVGAYMASAFAVPSLRTMIVQNVRRVFV